jgi:hypothetical protein
VPRSYLEKSITSERSSARPSSQRPILPVMVSVGGLPSLVLGVISPSGAVRLLGFRLFSEAGFTRAVSVVMCEIPYLAGANARATSECSSSTDSEPRLQRFIARSQL